jgi:dienelactone hydrolase
MLTLNIAYEAGDIQAIGYFACDESTTRARPGVLVAHEGFGLNEHAKSRARQLAKDGFAAFALDLFGHGKPIEGGMDAVRAQIAPLRADLPRLRRRVQAGLDVLGRQPQADESRLAAIGYCFGGLSVLELARSGAPIRGAVGFHSSLQTTRPEDARNIKAKVLVHVGADDPMISAQDRVAFEKEMSAGNVDWRMVIYGKVQHSFTNPDANVLNVPGLAYDRGADERSWRSTLDFFAEIFAT